MNYDALLAEADGLCKKATPEPWDSSPDEEAKRRYVVIAGSEVIAENMDVGDAEFCARARTLVPELTRAVRETRETIDTTRSELDGLVKTINTLGQECADAEQARDALRAENARLREEVAAVGAGAVELRFKHDALREALDLAGPYVDSAAISEKTRFMVAGRDAWEVQTKVRTALGVKP